MTQLFRTIAAEGQPSVVETDGSFCANGGPSRYPRRRMAGERSRARPRAVAQLAVLGGGLALALALTRASGQLGSWVRWVLPSLALIAAVSVWFRLHGNPPAQPGPSWWGSFASEADGPPRGNWVGVVLVCLLTTSFAVAGSLWPARRTLGFPPSALELGALVLLVPIAEEVFFRGGLLQSLRGYLGGTGATLVVSLSFGHLHNVQGQLWTMFAASLVLCALTLVTQTLFWAILLHATWNALTMVVRMPPTAGRLLMTGAVTVLVIGLVAFRISRRSRAES